VIVHNKTMSLETAAGIVADRIRRQEFVEVFAHHDADGIAAAAILCHAMLRAGIRFRLRVRQEIAATDITGDAAYLLCDLGAGVEDLPGDVMVVDHHLPLAKGEFHVNPRLSGIDGDRELSAAGAAYSVALKMGDNRDLAGLVIPGIIGDGQQMKGRNLEIFNEGIANGIIEPGRGITLPGRDMTERWYMAMNPYLDGISGAEDRIEAILGISRDPAQPGNGHDLGTLLSQVVLEAAPKTTTASLLAIWGDTYHLHREVIEDAHALTAVIDACGKAGFGDIAATLCLRSSAYVDRAWEIARQHRGRVIGAARTATPVAGYTGVYEIEGASLASDVADILARDVPHAKPVLVCGRSSDTCKISARCPPGTTADLGPLVRALAGSCGGNGGGHLLRAGATIPCDKVGMFAKGWQEATTA
jgi:hypothetical protein